MLVVLSAKQEKSICSIKQGIRQIVSNDSARLIIKIYCPFKNFFMKKLLRILMFPLPFCTYAQKWAKNFDYVDQCICGLSKIGKDNKVGYAVINGKIVIPVIYDEGLTFSEGYTAVRIKNTWIYLDSTGKQISDAQYEDAANFHNGRSAVMKGGLYGYIDVTGKVVIEFQFSYARSFSEGLAPVSNTRNLWGFIDDKGKISITPQYNFADSFKNGEARVMKGDKIFYIDKSNKALHE